ncbi:unnamed protein product, partial [Heterosigma akashiwo]
CIIWIILFQGEYASMGNEASQEGSADGTPAQHREAGVAKVSSLKARMAKRKLNR